MNISSLTSLYDRKEGSGLGLTKICRDRRRDSSAAL